MDCDNDTTSETSEHNKDIIDELEALVTELKTTNSHEEFFNHVVNINEKIDLIRKAVENLCTTTKSCLNSTNEKIDC